MNTKETKRKMRNRTIILLSIVLPIAVLGALAVVVGSSSHVSLCSLTSGSGESCTTTATVRGDRQFGPNSARDIDIAVQPGLFSNDGTAVVRLYDDNGNVQDYCAIDIIGKSKQRFGLGGCFKSLAPLYSEDAETPIDYSVQDMYDGETLTISVEYGSTLSGTSGSVGTTTFTFNK